MLSAHCLPPIFFWLFEILKPILRYSSFRTGPALHLGSGSGGSRSLCSLGTKSGVLGLSLAVVIADGRLDGVLSQHGAMQFDGGKRQLLCNDGVLDLASLSQRLASNKLSHVGRGGNGTATAKGLELDVLDDSVVVHSNLQLHDIATGGGSNQTSSDVLVILVHGSHVSGVVVVVQHLLMVASSRDGKRGHGRHDGGGGGSGSSEQTGRSGNSVEHHFRLCVFVREFLVWARLKCRVPLRFSSGVLGGSA